MIPVDFCQNNKPVNSYTTDDITSKFKLFSREKMDVLYLTESMRTDWLHMLDEYWDGVDTPYAGGFYLWTEWLFQYYNELPLCESIESAYIVCKSEQHILKTNY